MDHDYINEHGVVALYAASVSSRLRSRGSFAKGCGRWRTKMLRARVLPR
jgi:hypothetical protein